MRLFVFLLILANLIFFAWGAGYFGLTANPDATRLGQQLQADKVRVVSRDVPPAEPAPAKSAPPKAAPSTPAAPLEEICLQLDELTAAEADAIEARVNERLPAFKLARSASGGAPSYWVMIPPAANKQELDKKIADLKKLKVPEYFVVQDEGPYKRAISLGLFSRKEAATARRDALILLGVKTARIAERSAKSASFALAASGPGENADALRGAFAESLPGRPPTICKNRADAAP